MKRVAIGVWCTVGGYIVVALVGYFPVDWFSSNVHDRSVEAAMTSVRVRFVRCGRRLRGRFRARRPAGCQRGLEELAPMGCALWPNRLAARLRLLVAIQ